MLSQISRLRFPLALYRLAAMPWLNLLGHDTLVAHFRSALAQNRLGSTFLFIGPEGIGKRLFAHQLAQSLLCETRDEKLLEPCGTCPACLQVLAGTNPDFLTVARPAGKSFIPLGLLKGDEPDYPIHNSLLFNLALASLWRPPQSRRDRRCRLSESGRRQLSFKNLRRTAPTQCADPR